MFALAPLAAVVVALLAAILLLAALYLGKYIARVMPTNIPLIGSSIRSFIESASNLAIASIQGLLDNAVEPLVKVITAPVAVIGRLYDILLSTVNRIYSMTKTIVTVTIPRAISVAESYAATAVAAARRDLTDLVRATEAQLARAIDLARAYAAALVATARRDLTDLIRKTEAQLAAAIYAVRRYAEDLFHVAEAAAAAALATAVHTLTGMITELRTFTVDAIRTLDDLIQGKFAQAEADALAAAHAAELAAVGAIDAAVTTGLAGVWPSLVTDIDTLTGAWEDVFPDILTGVKDLARAIPRDIAGEAVLTGAMAGVLTRYLRDCGLPNCRNLSSLGRDLQALLGLVGDAGFLALVTGLALEPAATAREVDDVFGPVARDTADALTHLVGVR